MTATVPSSMAGSAHGRQPPEPQPGPLADPQGLDTRYAEVKARVAAAARRAGRRPEEIVLIAVTKFAEADQIRRLIQLGQRDFGENRVQNLIQRVGMAEEFIARHRIAPHVMSGEAGEALLSGTGLAVRWHMIGHLQRNKAKKAVELCRLIHSVDSLRLAEEIQAVSQKREQPVEVLIQVNCSGEKSKFGCPVPAAVHLAEQIDTMLSVRVRGLMTMAALDAGPEEARATFGRCRELFEEIAKTGVAEGRFNILSMGMSGDFEVAIEEGANVVRVGSAIFGEGRGGEEQDPEEP
jgi:pyridoxal phosphate enzyme (YggS family)